MTTPTATATTITITHSAADGTTLTGDPRPHHDLVKGAGFRYSRQAGLWYLPNSRDRARDPALVDRLADQLREIGGFTVEVSIDNATRPAAERETDRRARLTARSEGLESRAGRLAEESRAQFDRAHEMAGVIPMGQPILAGHHSQGRDQRYRDRIGRTMDRAVATGREAEETASRAQAARHNLASRDTAPVTLRRIQTLEAERRRIDRALTPCPASGQRTRPETQGAVTCPVCYHQVATTERVVADHGGATGEHRGRLEARAAELDDEIGYWADHLAALEAQGVKLWGPADFARGDEVRFKFGGPHWGIVLRVNKKSVTVRHPGAPDDLPADQLKAWTITVPWDDVVDRRARVDGTLQAQGKPPKEATPAGSRATPASR